MPMSGMWPDADIESPRAVIAGGYRGGRFHAATGFSFASAASFAQIVATTPIDELRSTISNNVRQQRHRGAFARFLNRLLFRMVRPSKRYQIFQRFYSVLPEERIARFYGYRFTMVDALRIVIGYPPGGLQPLRFARSIRQSMIRTRQVPNLTQTRLPHSRPRPVQQVSP